MAVPPKFADVGKIYRDLLDKDFPKHGLKVEANVNAEPLTVTATGTHTDGKIVAADLKFKYTDKAKGITFTNLVNTSSDLKSTFEAKNFLVKGATFELEGLFNPNKNCRNLKLVTGFSQAHINTDLTVALAHADKCTSNVTLNAVTNYDRVLLGVSANVDLSDKKFNLNKLNTAGSFLGNGYEVSVGTEAAGCAVPKNLSVSFVKDVVPRELTIGSSAKYTFDKKEVKLDLASRIALSPNAYLKAKVDSTGVAGVVYSQLIRPEVRMTVGGTVNKTLADSRVGVTFVYN
ncbi:hypothetical protein H696_01932 [Fonticula alba]|uniref:Voltage-dependent anion channel protein 2 n=1 Tax=Fonticula alba TaxID=691883 RepID=A0A058Z9T0_FONAL|nr:hypothetical protein H696_01932 [Fonticula alba]KCV70985.1 hypothetical protein H696_01932 [Fonticula alba]|eukprot:XP_009494108.1 hypothetical protein H696_01932 [Fonticula alba]